MTSDNLNELNNYLDKIYNISADDFQEKYYLENFLIKFYYGDQYTTEQKQTYREQNRIPLVVNKIKQYVDKIVGKMDNEKVSFKFSAEDPQLNQFTNTLNEELKELIKKLDFYKKTLEAFHLAMITGQVLIQISEEKGKLKIYKQSQYYISPNFKKTELFSDNDCEYVVLIKNPAKKNLIDILKKYEENLHKPFVEVIEDVNRSSYSFSDYSSNSKKVEDLTTVEEFYLRNYDNNTIIYLVRLKSTKEIILQLNLEKIPFIVFDLSYLDSDDINNSNTTRLNNINQLGGEGATSNLYDTSLDNIYFYQGYKSPIANLIGLQNNINIIYMYIVDALRCSAGSGAMIIDTSKLKSGQNIQKTKNSGILESIPNADLNSIVAPIPKATIPPQLFDISTILNGEFEKLIGDIKVDQTRNESALLFEMRQKEAYSLHENLFKKFYEFQESIINFFTKKLENVNSETIKIERLEIPQTNTQQNKQMMALLGMKELGLEVPEELIIQTSTLDSDTKNLLIEQVRKSKQSKEQLEQMTMQLQLKSQQLEIKNKELELLELTKKIEKTEEEITKSKTERLLKMPSDIRKTESETLKNLDEINNKNTSVKEGDV